LETVNFNNEQIVFQDLSDTLISFEILELNLQSNILNVKYNLQTYTLVLIKIDFENNILEVDSIPFLDNIINKLGNVFYNQGLIILTEIPGFNTSSFDLNFKSTQTIYEHEYLLIVNQDEFNVSTNPSAIVNVGKETLLTSTSDGKIVGTTTSTGVNYIRKKSTLENGNILDFRYTSSVNPNVFAGFEHYELSSSIDSAGSFLLPFITTIGLYDDDCQLVAVAKLPKPIKSESDIPVNFIIRFDT
jgi:hypothetical protein